MRRLILAVVLAVELMIGVMADMGCSGHEADESNRQVWYAVCVNSCDSGDDRCVMSCERDYGEK